METKKLSYDEFVGKGKETWVIAWSGCGGSHERSAMISGLPVGSNENYVKKVWLKKNHGKKFIGAEFISIK